ncbi:hypothetical protein BOTNAR_0089g00110 [Botryotinia narcissicola]|uniref:Ubiquitin 3 binding protein But2 C-terminal domain-containing protein n=1 Tax=Botryotinia narcissicola TaxID=278944 RepID=A0A4Z1IXY7_9HELO|nr:hypothetical protein BOTNAR_0089g00110 [Botryotinia narcissicola]
MFFKASTIAFIAAIGFASAAPTPTSDSSSAATSTVASDDCAIVWPGVLEYIWENTPQHVAYNTITQDPSDLDQGYFGMGATWNGTAWTSRQYTYASFDLPADAQNCELWSSFPSSRDDYEVITGPLDPQVEVFGPSILLDSSDLTYWDVFPVNGEPTVEVFTPNTLNPGQETLIGAFDCSSQAQFLMGIANLSDPGDFSYDVYQFRVNNTVARNYGLRRGNWHVINRGEMDGERGV